MNIQLVIAGMNRTDYLTRTLNSWWEHHPDLMSYHFQFHDTDGLGMAKAVSTAWTQVLEYDWSYLLWVEEDMVVERPLPLEPAIAQLAQHSNVTQMLFQRQSWNQLEHDTGSVLAAIKASAATFEQHNGWAEHDHIFSLNPCLIPRRIVMQGWPVGNEAEQTVRLRADAKTFGCWGTPETEPYITHIGHERGFGWKL